MIRCGSLGLALRAARVHACAYNCIWVARQNVEYYLPIPGWMRILMKRGRHRETTGRGSSAPCVGFNLPVMNTMGMLSTERLDEVVLRRRMRGLVVAANWTIAG